MRTTVKIDDQVFGDAKIEAMKAGMTFSAFVEAAVRRKLTRKPIELPGLERGRRTASTCALGHDKVHDGWIGGSRSRVAKGLDRSTGALAAR